MKHQMRLSRAGGAAHIDKNRCLKLSDVVYSFRCSTWYACFFLFKEYICLVMNLMLPMTLTSSCLMLVFCLILEQAGASCIYPIVYTLVWVSTAKNRVIKCLRITFHKSVVQYEKTVFITPLTFFNQRGMFSLVLWNLHSDEMHKFFSCFGIFHKGTGKSACGGFWVLIAYTSHYHTQVFCFNNNCNSHWI